MTSDDIQYEVWVRSRGANPYGIALDVPCRNARFDTREEAEAYCKDTKYSAFLGNHYYVRELK